MASFALFVFPVVVLVLFQRLPVQKALVWSILLGFLFLPNKTGFNLPLLPTLDRDTVPALSALVFAALALSRQNALAGPGTLSKAPSRVLEGWIPRNTLVRLLLIVLFAGIFMTTLTNTTPQFYGARVLPALRLFDAFSMSLTMLCTLVPFLLARKFLADDSAHQDLLRILIASGLIYSVFALIEVRLSPQFHNWVYGFHVKSWLQVHRGGGYRPTVFLIHGLTVGMFFAMTVVAAYSNFRLEKGQAATKALCVALWMSMTLVLANSFGALAIVMLIVPVILFLPKRLQLIFASSITIAFLIFPMLRSAGVVPVEQVVEYAAMIDQDRANSLAYRLENEDILLDKALDKPFFGWGGWARNRVFDDAGRDIGTTDGMWVIVLGVSGWVGYIATFGLLTVSILVLSLRGKRYQISHATVGLCLVLAANFIDFIPNANMLPITWLLAGALAGRLELSTADAEEKDEAQTAAAPRGPRYARPRPVKTREPVSVGHSRALQANRHHDTSRNS